MPGIFVNKRINQNGILVCNDNGKAEIDVDDIKGRVCYFSLSGDQALKAYTESKLSTIQKPNKRQTRLKEHVTERLYFAILMFDVVVMHCSDPLRSKIILEILEEHKKWIDEGRIVFIFSHHINNIELDFKKYIDGKRSEYAENENAQKEAESLSQEYMSDDYYERVIQILSSSKYLVRKSADSRFYFPNLVKADLENNTERIIVDTDSNLTQVFTWGLSLYQLLHARQLSKDGKKVNNIFPEDIVDGEDGVVESIREYLNQGTPIARSAIVDMIQKGIKEKNRKPTVLQRHFLKALTLRMDILYCRMNCGKQLILEFHPSYEGRSAYHSACFLEYIRSMMGIDKNFKLNYDMINKILQEPNLYEFRFRYLSCMADTIEHLNMSSSLRPTENELLLKDTFRVSLSRNVKPTASESEISEKNL